MKTSPKPSMSRERKHALKELDGEIYVNEVPIDDTHVFKSRDAWYFRIAASGLHPRRFGPYDEAETALISRDICLGKIREAFAEVKSCGDDELHVLEFVDDGATV